MRHRRTDLIAEVDPLDFFAADLVVASNSAKFKFTEVLLGSRRERWPRGQYVLHLIEHRTTIHTHHSRPHPAINWLPPSQAKVAKLLGEPIDVKRFMWWVRVH